MHFEEKASEVFLEKSMGRNLRIYKWFIAVCIELTVVPSTALALNIVLACEGTKNITVLFYEKGKAVEMIDKGKEAAQDTIKILNSQSLHGYPCREVGDQIYCAPCLGSPDVPKCEKNLKQGQIINSTSVDRLTGQATQVFTFFYDQMLSIHTFEGSCIEAKSRKF